MDTNLVIWIVFSLLNLFASAWWLSRYFITKQAEVWNFHKEISPYSTYTWKRVRQAYLFIAFTAFYIACMPMSAAYEPLDIIGRCLLVFAAYEFFLTIRPSKNTVLDKVYKYEVWKRTQKDQ